VELSVQMSTATPSSATRSWWGQSRTTSTTSHPEVHLPSGMSLRGGLGCTYTTVRDVTTGWIGVYSCPSTFDWWRCDWCRSGDFAAPIHPLGIQINTLRLKKVSPLMMDNNFGKCRLIFTILSPFDSSENSLMYIITMISPSPAVCCYTTLWKQKSRNVTDFDSILNKHLRCSWGHFEDLI